MEKGDKWIILIVVMIVGYLLIGLYWAISNSIDYTETKKNKKNKKDTK